MDKSKNTILYVDDEEHNLFAFRAAYRQHYTIYTALSGEEGLNILKQHPVKVVLTDQRMPNMSGVQFLEAMIPLYPDVIRMVLTGYSDIESVVHAINKGHVFRYVTKPWEETELKMTIDGAFQLYTTQEHNKRLLEELRQKTIDQEKIIEERTREIIEKNKHLEIQNIEIARRNKEITDSMHYAKSIQQAIMPSVTEFKSYLPSSFIVFKPLDIVSGDFYWFYKQDNRLFFAVCDCTGHGVPGALMSMIGFSLLNEVVVEKGIQQSDQVLNMLREAMVNTLVKSKLDTASRDGMDMALCIWDMSRNTLEFSGAKNSLYLVKNDHSLADTLQFFQSQYPSAAIKHNGSNLMEVKGDKQPIGYEQGIHFTPFNRVEIPLKAGDCFYICSDGFSDQFGGPMRKKFTNKRLKNLLSSIYTQPTSQQEQMLETALSEWKNKEQQTDDICIIGMKVE